MSKLVRISGFDPPTPNSPFSSAICAECRGPNCCEMDPPFLTERDVQAIVNFTGLNVDQFSEVQDIHQRPIHRMRQSSTRHCYFYDQESHRCRIYESRPVDCRLFPLDIARIQNRDTWILYTTCPLDTPLAKQTALEMAASAEQTLLPHLRDHLASYAECTSWRFDQGHWIELQEVKYLDESGARLLPHCEGKTRED